MGSETPGVAEYGLLATEYGEAEFIAGEASEGGTSAEYDRRCDEASRKRTALDAYHARLLADNERLRAIIVADGLDPDMPIPPGLALELRRTEAERDRMREALAELVGEFADALPYVPDHFRQKWGYDESLAAARRALETTGTEGT